MLVQSPSFQPPSRHHLKVMIAGAQSQISYNVAAAAGTSLQAEIDKKREDEDLSAGKKTVEKLEWTPETTEAAQQLGNVSFPA